MEDILYKFDGVLWKSTTFPTPFCPIHRLEMDPFYDTDDPKKEEKYLKCEDCDDYYTLPRSLSHERTYIERKLQSKKLKAYKILNIDEESIPVAEAKVDTKKSKFFILTNLTESKIGKRLIIYAGEKGKKEKTQIFVEPEIKRLSFDQNNLHPNDIFLRVEAEFSDGTKQIMKSKKIK